MILNCKVFGIFSIPSFRYKVNKLVAVKASYISIDLFAHLFYNIYVGYLKFNLKWIKELLIQIVNVIMKIYNKLVRDNIPEIIKNNGQTAYISVLDNEQYNTELKKKLVEEMNEFLESSQTEELADIIEVVEALAKEQGSSLENVLEIKQKKAAKNGKFEKRLFLEKVEG